MPYVIQATSDASDNPNAPQNSDAHTLLDLLESLPGLIYIFDLAENRDVYVNANGIRLLGYQPADFHALGDSFLSALIHPDDVLHWQEQVMPRYAEAGDDTIIESEFRIRQADGQWRWFSTHERVWQRAPDGAPQQIFAVGQDITERMRSEVQMRYQAKLLENVHDAVIVTDLNYVVQTWNPAAQSIYGWSAEEIVGQPLTALLQTEFVDDGLATAARMGLANGSWHGEVLQLRKDGSRAHIFASVALVTDVTGAPSGWVAINRDVSDEKALSQALAQERAILAQRVEERTAELRAANAELVKASQLKDDFLAAVSHELRTPMQGVLGFTENLRQGIIGPLNARQERYLDLIMESAQHLLALINDILDFTKTGATPTKLDLLALPVIYLCESSMTMVREAALRKHLRVSLALEDRGLVAVVDERVIRQILVNLLGNAVKFTPEGGAIGIDVTLDPTDEKVLFTVWDTGIGIADKDKERLFQPFVQLDSGLNRQYGGTGLGLALSTRLAAVHGGTISLESTPGVGSRFTLSIPRQHPQQLPQTD